MSLVIDVSGEYSEIKMAGGACRRVMMYDVSRGYFT